MSESASTRLPLTPFDLLSRAERIVERQREVDESHVELLLSIGGHYTALFHSQKAFGVLSTAYDRSRGLADPGVRARAACAFARALADRNEGERAEQLVQETLRTLPDEPQYAPHRVNCYLFGSGIAQVRRDGALAIERVRAADAASKAAGLSSRFLAFLIASNLASAYSHASRVPEALAAFADAERQLELLGRDETLTAGRLLVNWSSLLYIIGRPLDAEPLLRRALAVTNRNQNGPMSIPRIHLALARCLNVLHRWPEAASHTAYALAAARRGGDEATVTSAQLLQASLYRQLGDGARAARLLAEIEPRLKRLPAPDDSVTLSIVAAERAWLAVEGGEPRVAFALADRAVALTEALKLRSSGARSLMYRARIALRLDRPELARTDALRALELEQQVAGAGNVSSGVGRAHLAIAQALHAQGKLAEARAVAYAAVEHLTPALGADHPETRLAKQLAAGETRKR